MKRERYFGKLPFIADNIRYFRIKRPAGHKVFFSDGRSGNTFVFVLSGHIEYFPKSKEAVTDIYSGEIAFFPEGTRHNAVYSENSTVEVVRFDTVFGAAEGIFLTEFKKRMPSCDGIFGAMRGTRSQNPMFLASKLYELLSAVDDDAHGLPKRFENIKPAISEIETKYHENRKISYYAALCGMSESGFRRAFGEYTGVSPIEYRNGLRLNEAREMIMCGEYSVEEAAFETGFSNISFFYDAYKKKFGTTPKRGTAGC